MPYPSIETFREHIVSRGHDRTGNEWKTIRSQLDPVRAKRGDILLDSTVITEHLIFICDGIAASFQLTADGDTQIARFFERGQLCSNISSAWHRSVSNDELVAMTDLVGVRIPFSMFRDAFLSGGPLALYWREMVLETLLFDKDLMCTKTIRDVDTRYRFLAERYENVVADVPDKHLARFLGITPQGLSRFLKNNRPDLT